MKVNSVENSVYQKQSLKSPQFKAKGMDSEVWNYITKNSGKVSRFFNYVGENQGEALNIIVTAVGTAIICPLFIAFNPFSKEDEKTKQYSAWRQPISAVIALVTQLTITKWFNDWLTKYASTKDKDGKPHLARANLIPCPHERYLKNGIKHDHPEFNKKQIEEEVKKRQIDAEKAEIKKMRQVMKDKQFEYKELVCQDYIDKARDNFFEAFKKDNKEEIEKALGKELDKIGSLKLKKYLEKMLEEKAKSMGKDTQTLLNETAEKLVERDVIMETVAKMSVRYLGNKNGITATQAIEYCADKDKLNLENIVKLIKEQGLEEKLPKDYDIEKLAKDIVDKLTHMHDYECENQMKDFTSLKNIGKTFEEILQNVKIKRYVRSMASDSKRVFKTMNTQLGLIVTLATLPFTCGFLNWSYPRIMEKIMPEMSAKKKDIEEKIGNFNAKIEEAVDKLNLDELKGIINIDELKNKLKFELEKGGDN